MVPIYPMSIYRVKSSYDLHPASAYTEMNAISKGVSIGVFDHSRGKGIELKKGESQPYVDLMGRRYVLPQFLFKRTHQ